MSFTASLFKIIESSTTIRINTRVAWLDDEAITTRPSFRRFTLSNGECSELEFSQQEVTVDDVGAFTAVDTQGKACNFIALVEKNIVELDLNIKKRARESMPKTITAQVKPFSEHHEKIFVQLLDSGSYTFVGNFFGLKPNKVREVCLNVAAGLLSLEKTPAASWPQSYTQTTASSFKANKSEWLERVEHYHRLQDQLARNAL